MALGTWLSAVLRTKKVAVLIDAENIGVQAGEAALDVARALGGQSICRAYANWRALGTARQLWCKEHGVEMVQVDRAARGKNSSDIALAIEATHLVFARNIRTVVIVSNDSDFLFLVRYLREKGVQVYGVGSHLTYDLRDLYTDFYACDSRLHPAMFRPQAVALAERLAAVYRAMDSEGAGLWFRPSEFKAGQLRLCPDLQVPPGVPKRLLALIKFFPHQFVVCYSGTEPFFRLRPRVLIPGRPVWQVVAGRLATWIQAGYHVFATAVSAIRQAVRSCVASKIRGSRPVAAGSGPAPLGEIERQLVEAYLRMDVHGDNAWMDAGGLKAKLLELNPSFAVPAGLPRKFSALIRKFPHRFETHRSGTVLNVRLRKAVQVERTPEAFCGQAVSGMSRP